jgi:site-specific DNA-methyltransferase (adenine-specific)
MLEGRYNPDVLTCLANLSNDEVFTPPTVANAMLDLLPASIWNDPNAKFIDPFTKSGVFLREISKRLLNGLENEFPILQDRIDHILKNQIYGIAITELTGLMSRRSLYCSKNANGNYSISNDMGSPDGNIRFEESIHNWKNGKCTFCGANESAYDRGGDLESHAYEFVHTKDPEGIFGMKFDVVVGNPPYQLETGGSNRQATPLYDKFVEQAKKLNPRFITMIIPARWYAGGMGLTSFRETMISDDRISALHDFPVTSDCFPGVNIRGGVCYFLWDREYSGPCEVHNHNGNSNNVSVRRLNDYGDGVFLRYNDAISIIEKVSTHNELKFDELVSSQRPFGLPTNFGKFKSSRDDDHEIVLYKSGGLGYVRREDVESGHDMLGCYKILMAKASPGADVFPHLVLSKPIVAPPGSCCTETYLTVHPTDSAEVAENVAAYLRTKFARFLVLMMKPTQDVLKRAYSLLPQQDFNMRWDDSALYEKYGISDVEIAFINSLVKD